MPRKYARKSNRNSWDEAGVTRAIAAVESGEPLKRASKLFGVPRTTLKAVSHITGWPKRRGNGDPKMSLRWCSSVFVDVRWCAFCQFCMRLSYWTHPFVSGGCYCSKVLSRLTGLHKRRGNGDPKCHSVGFCLVSVREHP